MVIVPPDTATDAGPFSAEDRAIFAYDLGSGRPDYRGDPLAIEDRYEASMARYDADVLQKWLNRPVLSVRLLGYGRLLPVVRAAFGLPAYGEADPDGITAREALALLDRFFAYQDRIRAAYRREAELLATYGTLPGRRHSYEREVGLWLNRDRARAFAGLAHWRGAIAASGVATAHPSLVDAMAPNEEVALRLAERIESDRAQAQAQAESQASRRAR